MGLVWGVLGHIFWGWWKEARTNRKERKERKERQRDEWFIGLSNSLRMDMEFVVRREMASTGDQIAKAVKAHVEKVLERRI